MVYKYNFDKIQPGAHKLISNSEYKERFDILVELLYKYDIKFKDGTLRPKQAIQTLITSSPPLSEEQQKIIYRGLSLLLHPDKFNSDILSAKRFNKETSEYLFKKIGNLLQDKKMLEILKNSLKILKERGESSIANTSIHSEKTQRPPQTRPTNIPHNYPQRQPQDISKQIVAKCNDIAYLYEQMQYSTHNPLLLKKYCEALSSVYSEVYALYTALPTGTKKRQMESYVASVAPKYQKTVILYDITNVNLILQEIKRQSQNGAINDLAYKKALNAYNHLITKMSNYNIQLKNLCVDPIIQKQMNNVKQLIKDITVTYKDQQKSIPKEENFLTPYQTDIVRLYFKQHPKATKLSKSTPLFMDGKQIKIPYSVIKSADGKLYALYNSRQIYNPKNLKGILGQGSYGQVKLAQCLDDGRLIAAKIQVVSTRQQLNEIQKEENIQQAVNQYLGSGARQNYQYKTKYYTFSKFIEGQSLANYFRNNPRLPMAHKLRIILDVLKATQDLHNQKIIHGDLSFNNILYDAKTGKVTIIDFGFSGKATASNSIRLPFIIPFNPRGYYAPEGETGKITNMSDIYNLGKWIEWAVAGSDPFLRDLSAKMANLNAFNRLDAIACIKVIEKKLYEENVKASRFRPNL